MSLWSKKNFTLYLEADKYFDVGFGSFPAVWPWATYLTSLKSISSPMECV